MPLYTASWRSVTPQWQISHLDAKKPPKIRGQTSLEEALVSEIRSHLPSMSLTPAPWGALLLCPATHAGLTQVLMRSWAITELREAKSSPVWKRKGKPSHQQGHQYKILRQGRESWLSLRLPLREGIRHPAGNGLLPCRESVGRGLISFVRPERFQPAGGFLPGCLGKGGWMAGIAGMLRQQTRGTGFIMYSQPTTAPLGIKSALSKLCVTFCLENLWQNSRVTA